MPKSKDYEGEEQSFEVDKSTGKGISILGEKGRKWLLTINNPEKHGVDMSMQGILTVLKDETENGRISYVTAIMEQSLKVDDVGKHTRHGHILIYYPKEAYGSQVHKSFPTAAMELCTGNVPSIVNYIRKDTSGAWYKSHPEKLGEKLSPEEANYWEWGDMPDRKKDKADDSGSKNDSVSENARIVAAVLEGKTDAEIITKYPYAWRRPAELRKVRYAIMSERYRSFYRDLVGVYIEANMPPQQIHQLYPATRDTYVVSDYTHPWDSYCAEKTVVLLDYVGQFPFRELKRLLSGNYCTLPARFSDAVACYNTIIIISPLSMKDMCAAAKGYDAEVLDTYFRHLRTYQSLDDEGSDYIRNQSTGEWKRLYLLPPHLVTDKEMTHDE